MCEKRNGAKSEDFVGFGEKKRTEDRPPSNNYP
jgi:hypothetical protein